MVPELADYERFIYTLPEAFPSIRRSTLVVIHRGPALAEVTGTIEFDQDITLGVWEDLNLARHGIQAYSYWVDQESERLYWYDPQPHPSEPSLANTHPHHKHIPPDIKRHRIPAPNIRFDRPNLPDLIREIEETLL